MRIARIIYLVNNQTEFILFTAQADCFVFIRGWGGAYYLSAGVCIYVGLTSETSICVYHIIIYSKMVTGKIAVCAIL